LSTPNLIEIENQLKGKIDAHLEKDIRDYPRHTNWAGDLGFECDTYHALARIHPELRPTKSLNLIKIFRTGNVYETPNIQLMQNAGLDVVEQARSYQWREKKISGRIDGKIRVPEIGGLIPLEHKACSPNIFRSVKKMKAEGTPLTKAKTPWTRNYPGQLTAYALMDGEEFGCWFFFDKVIGDYFFWILPLDLEYAESLIQRAERANENVEKKTVPQPERKEICLTCDFNKTSCFVGQDFGPGFEMLDAEDLILKLQRWQETKMAFSEHEDLDEEIKDLFRGRQAIVGDFKITSKPCHRKGFVMPASDYFKTTIEVLGEKP